LALDRGEGALDRFDRGERERGTLISQVSPCIRAACMYSRGFMLIASWGALFVPALMSPVPKRGARRPLSLTLCDPSVILIQACFRLRDRRLLFAGTLLRGGRGGS
jgi:hypothetical protein